MADRKFRLAFKGDIAPGAEIDKVKNNLCALLKKDITKIEMLFSGKPIILKNDIPENEVLKLKGIFEKTGAIAIVEPIIEDSPSAATESMDQLPLTCPKCGAKQQKSTACINCGVVFAKIKESTERQIHTQSDHALNYEPVAEIKRLPLIKSIVQYTLMTVLGAITCLATAGLLYGIESVLDFAFYTWTLWFVLPVGALLSGYAAATGYSFGAKIINHRPGRILTINMVLVSIGTFFLVNYFAYNNLEIKGVPVKTIVSYWQYLDAVLTHSSVSFRIYASPVASTGELGAFGYVYALLQIAGFAGGGLAAYGFLAGEPYCQSCQRFYRRHTRVRKFTDNAKLLENLLGQVAPLISSGNLSEALSTLQAFGHAKFKSKDHLRVEASLWRCSSCRKRMIRLSVCKRAGNNWKEIPECKQQSTSLAPVVTASTAV